MRPASQPTIHVIATTPGGTCAALAAAVPLAKGSGARLIVTIPRVVSYAVELDGSIIASEFIVRRYRDLVADLGGQAQIDVCLCRSIQAVVAKLVAGNSTIVVGGSAGRWLPSAEERFANRLSRHGHRVIFVPCADSTTERRVFAAAGAALLLASVAVAGVSL
jgi:hypothetical protein